MINYIKQWNAPSSSGTKMYKVSLTDCLEYQCSCAGWTTHVPRRDCKHIIAAKNGEYDELDTPEYNLQPGNVGQVTRTHDNTFLIPLVPFNDNTTDILATIIYDLLQFGVSWKQAKNYCSIIPKEWTRDQIAYHVSRYGRCVYTEWIKGQGWTNLKFMPV